MIQRTRPEHCSKENPDQAERAGAGVSGKARVPLERALDRVVPSFLSGRNDNCHEGDAFFMMEGPKRHS